MKFKKTAIFIIILIFLFISTNMYTMVVVAEDKENIQEYLSDMAKSSESINLR